MKKPRTLQHSDGTYYFYKNREGLKKAVAKAVDKIVDDERKARRLKKQKNKRPSIK